MALAFFHLSGHWRVATLRGTLIPPKRSDLPWTKGVAGGIILLFLRPLRSWCYFSFFASVRAARRAALAVGRSQSGRFISECPGSAAARAKRGKSIWQSVRRVWNIPQQQKPSSVFHLQQKETFISHLRYLEHLVAPENGSCDFVFARRRECSEQVHGKAVNRLRSCTLI